jgi:hypothetical protein
MFKILSFIIYGLVIKLYDDIIDNKQFIGKYFNDLHIEILKSLMIFFLILTIVFVPNWSIATLGLTIITINDLDNNFWVSYLICSIIGFIYAFNKLTFDFGTIIGFIILFIVAAIDVVFFSEDFSFNKNIWRLSVFLSFSCSLLLMCINSYFYNECFFYSVICIITYCIVYFFNKQFIKYENIKENTEKNIQEIDKQDDKEKLE